MKKLGGALVAGVGAADAALKVYALQHFPNEQAAPLQPVLAFAIHRNRGIAFDIPIPLGIVVPITLLICVAFSVLAYKYRHTNAPQALSAFAAVIGALGNGVDRIIHGFTTDYLIFFRTSAINLSDVLILIGILGVLWYDKRNPSPSADPHA